MIRADYQDFFKQLKQSLIANNFECTVLKESELYAELLIKNKWILEFECEKYYGPSFTISICPPKSIQKKSKSYAVWILMRIFEKKFRGNYGVYTIENQIGFLNNEKEKIFINEIDFDDDYDSYNQDLI